ncbi:MAG: chlorophyll synthase ChlG [Rubrivivax sp.]|jgi:chlorophyll synthase|nr:chlorophyll synthase ChlG [Rubrivivax sp.]
MALPAPSAIAELFKPITWFPPMWAFACGVVASGEALSGRYWLIAAGVVLAGPMVCATSQAVNDWYDRHVDAVNEPHRPIPSGRMPGRWGLYMAVLWTVLSLLLAAVIGPVGLAAAAVGLALAWAYSAPPLRLKRNGWLGNAACGLSYESLAWITGAAVMVGGLPGMPTLSLALLYGLGAHGIMTLNDFKSMEGDRRHGIASLPVALGPQRAAQVACLTMLVPQGVVVALLLAWGTPWHAAGVGALMVAQALLMRRFLGSPTERALWYSGFGVTLYVLGMLIAALALRSVTAAGTLS